MNWPSFLQNPMRILGGAAAVGAVAVTVVARPPRGLDEPSKSRPAIRMEAPDADKLNERIPDTGSVLEKHLFVSGREATGQNSFPDLIVKGVFIGTERSAILSLKSTPQTNLRVWLGEVEGTLNSITDPRDPRQTLVTFLREWPIKEISRDSLIVEHFITGEVETYDVDYVAARKVKDDAQRGYGQGVMPQEKVASANAAKKAKQSNAKNGKTQTGGIQFMPPMLQNLSPQQQMQFMQRMMQGGGAAGKNTQNANTKTSSEKSSKNSKKR